jgi:hypothetical protein
VGNGQGDEVGKFQVSKFQGFKEAALGDDILVAGLKPAIFATLKPFLKSKEK